MRILLSFSFCLMVFASAAQKTTPVIDSLKKLVLITDSEKEKVDVYNKIAFQYLFIDTIMSLAYIDTASMISKENDYSQGLARALNINAIHHSFQNRQDQSIELNKRALSHCKDEDHKVKGKIYNGLGMSYQRGYIVDKSLEYYQKALFHASEVKDTLTMSIVLGNIASVNNTQDHDEEAKKYYLQLEKIASNYRDQNVQYAFHMRFAEFLTSQDEFEESNKYLAKALKNAETLNHKSKIRIVRLYLVINSINLKQYELSEIYLKNLISPEIDPNEHTFVRYHYWNSDLYFRQKKNRASIYHAKIGLEKIEQYNDYHFYKPRFLKLIHQAEFQMNNFQNAYSYLEELKSWQDSVDLKERENKFIEIESKYQAEKREIENALLLEQSNSKSIALKQRTTIATVSLFALLLSLFLVYILYRNSKKDKSNNELLELRVKERTQKLLKSNEELERFAYIASHDLKEPITTISSFTRLLKQKLNPDQKSEQIDQCLDIIEKSSDQMQFLVNGILDYTRLGEEVPKEAINLNLTMQKVEVYLHQLISSKNAKIIYKNLPSIHCNPIHIFQIFKNIVENGIKYNEATDCKVEVDFVDFSDHIILNFVDNGIGIDEKYKEKIFGMFARLNNRSEYTGSGLGLSIVKKITNLMGGDVTLEKSDKNGSTFSVMLPKNGM